MSLFKRPSFIPTPEQRAASKKAREERWAAQDRARRLHQQRLERAAGISSLTLRCHPETWSYVIVMAGMKWSLDVPQPRKLDNGLVEVDLSGPIVVRLLENAWQLSPYTPPVTAALTRRLNRSLIAVVDQVDPDAPTRPLPPVVLDDRAAVPDDE